MKYSSFLIAITLTTLLAVTACTSCGNDSKKKSWSGETERNPRVEEIDETPDSAHLVVLNDFDADSIYIYDRNTQQNRSYYYPDAKASGNFKGTLKKGNRYSILTESKYKKVLIAINVTELWLHDWFYDSQKLRGMSFNINGGMSSINAEDICFREWKLQNGKLYIYYVDLQQAANDRHSYKVEEADLVELNADQLTLNFLGKTYNCKKPSSKPAVLGQ